MTYPQVSGGLDGGYFAGPVVTQPAYPPAGYGPPPAQTGGWGGTPAQPPAATSDQPPIWVVAAATVLVLTGAAAAWVGVTVVVAVNGLGAGMDAEGALVRALLLLVNAALNVALAYQLLRGAAAARLVVAGVCGWWVLYWLYQTSKASEATGSLATAALPVSLGGIGTMVVLGLLGLASLAAATAGVLWTSSAGRHFSR